MTLENPAQTWKPANFGKQSLYLLINIKPPVTPQVGRIGHSTTGGVERPQNQRPSTRVVYGQQVTLPVGRQGDKTKSTCNSFLRLKLTLANDVETNPGPQISITTQNVSGMKDINKSRRIFNNAYKDLRAEIAIVGLQETHIDETHEQRITHQWRHQAIISPSTGNAKGTILPYNENSFDLVNETDKDPEGRWASLTATKADTTYLFCCVYGPNNQHRTFYQALIETINNKVRNHQVNAIFILGDLNLNLNRNDRRIPADKRNATNDIRSLMYNESLTVLSDPSKHTWQRGNNHSTIDFIIGPKHYKNCTKTANTWGKEISDHAAITCQITQQEAKRANIPRINLEFTEDDELSDLFRDELKRIIDQTDNTNWNPHTQLEFVKTAIRSAAAFVEGIYKNKFNNQLKDSQIRLNQLHMDLDHIDLTEEDKNRTNEAILQEKTINDELLERRSKYLANRARLNWIEKGEKNNKYFMNIIKANGTKQMINELNINGESVTDHKTFPGHIHKFYNKLYNNEGNKNHIDEYLQSITVNELNDEDNRDLSKPITLAELTNTLRTTSGTTPGPDGIGNQVYKIC